MGRTISFLLVEDDEFDRRLFKRTLKDNQIHNPVVTASNGLEALKILREASEEGVSYPFIIFTDIKMPVMGGIKFIEELRADPILRNSIVYVCSGVVDDNVIKECDRLGVRDYIIKRNLSSFLKNVAVDLNYGWTLVA